GEEFARLLAGHLQHFGDGAALVVHLQRLAVVALAVADVARDVDVGQEMHFHPRHAVPLTGLAAPPLHVEREPARTVAALTRSRHAREQLAYGREQSGVGRWIGARRAPDRTLVDAHHLVEELQPGHRSVRGRLLG